jgi:hypothetical protein
MATATPFAYNTGASIPGTTQVGNLSVGTPTSGFTSSPQYWNGPDQTTGYVIAAPVSGNTQPTYLIYSATSTELLTMSSVYKGNDILLAGGGVIAYQQFGYQQTALCNTIISPTSKVMFSVTCALGNPPTQPNSHFIGIGRLSMNYQGNPYGGYPGNDSDSMGYGSDGNIWYQGTIYASGLQSWGNSDVIDVVIDNAVNSMWVRVNGGYWNNNDSADPAANTFGIEIINGPFYPAICPGYEGTMSIEYIATYGVPSGFTLLGTNVTASVGFYQTVGFADNDFINLSQSVSNEYGTPQTFTGASEASSWLTTNGFWNSYGLLSSFTINPSDFTNGGPIYQDTFAVGTNGVDGFVNTAAQANFDQGYYGDGLTAGAISTISAAITQAGLNPASSTGYIWSVTWGAGSSVGSGYVKFGFSSGGGYFDIQAVDPADADWQIPGNGNGTTLAGTFLLPATFTQYLPLTNKGGWC